MLLLRPLAVGVVALLLLVFGWVSFPTGGLLLIFAAGYGAIIIWEQVTLTEPPVVIELVAVGGVILAVFSLFFVDLTGSF